MATHMAASRTENPLSYWTITETRSAGVGILCSPKVSCKIKPWREEEWTSRIMAVEVDKWIVVNVYAPSDKGKKPAFFKELNRWLKHHEGVIVGGDFNCVLRPNKDRVVARKPSTAGCESIELKELVDIHELTDAVEMNRDLDMEEEDNDPLQHYTFWRKDGASRLDRFYVKGEPMLVTQWVDVLNPAHDSDHQEVRLELATGTPQSRIHSMKPYYPIRSGRPQRIRDKIEANLVPLLDRFESSDHPVAEWDKLVTEIQETLRVTRSRDIQQTDRYFKTLRAETRIPRSTRGEIMEDLAKSARRHASRSFGQRLIGSPEEIRRFYKRNSDWQRDQTISQIRPSAGHFYEDNYPIEERMASEWSHIFAKSHATATEEELDERLNHFVNIPEDIRVTKEETEALAAPITEFETWEAIQKLKRHKTAGTTEILEIS
ncbi:hypothetical protein PHMEG_00015143 [Phytophthora megakarya]|uniref:Endonuclease/exonuclease/phosphatase domain-containing protein n=1 Tax=Phytophthora megakarya TaxID=4795 RepID=A0A225W2H7_9STRA|nr:hypothetical protein PHMEG_00015143 [Phytophthora megakarya]